VVDVMNKKITIITSSVAVGIVLLAGYFISHSGMQSEAVFSSNQQITAAKAINQKVYDDADNNRSVSIEHANVPSLTGITHEANIRADSTGNFIVDESIKHLFEFYLSSVGEESLELILQRVQAELSSELEPPALDQALSLLKRYVDYKIELSTIEQALPQQSEQNNSDLENIKHQKSQLNALRAQYFDQIEYQQFFEQEELYDNYMLNHLSIVGDQSLDKETKRQNLESLEQTLPEDVRAVRQQVTLHGNLYEQAKTMKAEGASNEEVFQLRAVSLGEDAARAMAKLDADRALWQQRLTNYSQQKNIINDSGLSKQDQLLAINDLIETNFSGTERLRVKALSSSL
jgi:lipase chaperone LimK